MVQLVIFVALAEIFDQLLDLPLQLIFSSHDVLLLVLRLQHLENLLDLHPCVQILNQPFSKVHHVVYELLLTEGCGVNCGLIAQRPQEGALLRSKLLAHHLTCLELIVFVVQPLEELAQQLLLLAPDLQVRALDKELLLVDAENATLPLNLGLEAEADGQLVRFVKADGGA